MALLVNGEQIDDSVLQQERRTIRRALVERMPELSAAEIDKRSKEWAAENLIERVLMRQEAARDPNPVPADEIEQQLRALQSSVGDQPNHEQAADSEQLRRDVETQIKVKRLIARLTSHVARPRRKDLVEFYKKNRESFYAPEAVHAAHIIKNVDEKTTEEAAKSAIESVRDALKNGGEFEKLADEFSDCPGRGGDLGFFGRGEMVNEFESVAFAMAPGEISDIIRTPFGFHIIKAYSRREEGVMPFEDVSSAIDERLFAEKNEKVLNQHVDALRAKAEIREIAAAK